MKHSITLPTRSETLRKPSCSGVYRNNLFCCFALCTLYRDVRTTEAAKALANNARRSNSETMAFRFAWHAAHPMVMNDTSFGRSYVDLPFQTLIFCERTRPAPQKTPVRNKNARSDMGKCLGPQKTHDVVRRTSAYCKPERVEEHRTCQKTTLSGKKQQRNTLCPHRVKRDTICDPCSSAHTNVLCDISKANS